MLYPKNITGDHYNSKAFAARAHQLHWDGSNLGEIIEFIQPLNLITISFDEKTGSPTLYVRDGNKGLPVRPSDWIIRSEFGTWLSVPHDVFQETYIKVTK